MTSRGLSPADNPAPARPSHADADRSGKAYAVVVGLFLLVYLPFQVASTTRRSATVDEPVHLAAGYAALAEGDYRFDPTHPPLLRMWAALPLLLQRPAPPGLGTLDEVPLLDWVNVHTYTAAARFIGSGGHPDELLAPSRLMITLLGALLGLLVFCWAHELMGFTPAVLALVLYTLEPNLSVHATLVTTDLGVTCFFFGTLYFLWRVQHACTGWNLLGLAVFFSLALLTKFSALVLAPIILLLLILTDRLAPGTDRRRIPAIVGLLAATGCLALWAAYGFRYAPGAGGTGLIDAAAIPAVAEQAPFLSAVLHQVDAWRLLPNAYTQGLLLSQTTAEAVPGYFSGALGTGGWWLYFPVAFLIKTPVVLLGLFFAGLILYLRRRDPAQSSNRLWMLVPIGVYLAFAIPSSINIGLRHILPIYPFVILTAVAACRELLVAGRRLGRITACAAIAVAVVRSASAWPQSLSYFNALVGGPANGHKYLSDSNLDWGQGLKHLQLWMRENGVEQVNLAYSGTVAPEAYGLAANLLPGSVGYLGVRAPVLPGYVAIGTTIQSGVGLSPEWVLFYEGFSRLTPVAMAGNTVRIYHVDAWPMPEAAPGDSPDENRLTAQLTLGQELLHRLAWPAGAVPYLHRYLAARPHDLAARADLALALLRADRTKEALDEIAHIVARHPDRITAAIAATELLVTHRLPEEAIRYAELAAAAQPDNPRAQDNLGVALVGIDRPHAALARFRRALELDASHAPAREHLARITHLLATTPEKAAAAPVR